ncbi:MAG: hypothetical protein OH363_05015 [Candidatus Parvarchaeota archaeon]|nr:hypothetical protein [Candidatus Jingweiarchaeum tengchongense]
MEEDLVNSFWKLDAVYYFSSYEIALYFALLYVSKNRGQEPLYIPNEWFLERMKCSKPTFIRARKRLNDLHIIRYEKGTTRSAGTYYLMFNQSPTAEQGLVNVVNQSQTTDPRLVNVVNQSPTAEQGLVNVVNQSLEPNNAQKEKQEKQESKEKEVIQEKENKESKEIKEKKEKERNNTKKEKEKIANEIFNFYLLKSGKHQKLSPALMQKCLSRLKSFSADELKTAIEHMLANEYMLGTNENQRFYATFEYIVRNDENVEKWKEANNGRKTRADILHDAIYGPVFDDTTSLASLEYRPTA